MSVDELVSKGANAPMLTLYSFHAMLILHRNHTDPQSPFGQGLLGVFLFLASSPLQK